MKLAAYIAFPSAIASLILYSTVGTPFWPMVLVIALPACLGAAVYHLLRRKFRPDIWMSAVSSFLSGVFSSVSFFGILSLVIHCNSTDDGIALYIAALLLTPIVFVSAAIFGAGVGQRKRQEPESDG